jgi:DNA ligase 1
LATPFETIAELVPRLEQTSKRLEKRRLIAEFLRRLSRAEVPPAVLLLVAGIFPESDSKVLNVGFATVHRALETSGERPAEAPPLTILEVQQRFEEIAAVRGPESTHARKRLLEELFGRASKKEQQILLKAIFGEMRIGVNEGVMIEAIADGAQLDVATVRTANMYLGDLGKVAAIALFDGAKGVEGVSAELLFPIKPMLAELAPDLDQVLTEHGGTTAVEFKLDGARIQIHRVGDRVRVFSRRLSDVTRSVPEVVETARELSASSFILEGEVLAADETGRPRPFQELMRRFRRVHEIEALRKELPLSLFCFDLLHLNGINLMAAPYRDRWEALKGLVPAPMLVPRLVTSNRTEIEQFLEQALAAGHEGLMAKRLGAPYAVGKRGKNWLKIKPADTLDLVILAAEWGHGRRTGSLSNYWLGIRDGSGWQMIGKTFKGLTDRQRADLMKRLLEAKSLEDSWVVHVRPEVVVEVTYNEIQRSPRYQSGFALRFARITRIREDKGPGDADSYERLKELYNKQFERKGKSFGEV